jgi:hypothetical protein
LLLEDTEICEPPKELRSLQMHLEQAFRVALDGYAMQLRPSELESVAAGLGEFDSSKEGDQITLAEAVRRLPANDRAPAWELAVRRYGRHKPLRQAAGEIGMDVVHAQDLMERFGVLLLAVPAPETVAVEPKGGLRTED